MDKLSLKKYHIKDSLVGSEINPLKGVSKGKGAAVGHAALADKGQIKRTQEFLEFFINGESLSELLDKFYSSKDSILQNSIGVLGLLQNEKAEIIKLKQLLGKTVSEGDIRQVYPASWTTQEFEWYLDKYNEELANPEILIYGCALCGDYDCGGVTATIEKTENLVIWTFSESDKFIQFTFDKYHYFNILGNRLKKLQSQ